MKACILISSRLCPESSRDLGLHLQNSDSAFAAVVMMGYALMVEESKEIVLAQDDSVLQSLELLPVVAYILVKESVHPFLEGLPDLRSGHSAFAFIPCVYGIAQQFLHTACPLLFLVDVAEVLQIPKQMGKADLMAADLQREVGAVTVCIEYEPLQVRQYAMFLQCLGV